MTKIRKNVLKTAGMITPKIIASCSEVTALPSFRECIPWSGKGEGVSLSS